MAATPVGTFIRDGQRNVAFPQRVQWKKERFEHKRERGDRPAELSLTVLKVSRVQWRQKESLAIASEVGRTIAAAGGRVGGRAGV